MGDFGGWALILGFVLVIFLAGLGQSKRTITKVKSYQAQVAHLPLQPYQVLLNIIAVPILVIIFGMLALLVYGNIMSH